MVWCGGTSLSVCRGLTFGWREEAQKRESDEGRRLKQVGRWIAQRRVKAWRFAPETHVPSQSAQPFTEL